MRSNIRGFVFIVFSNREWRQSVMELLKLEHKKLWRRKNVQIGVLLTFLYVVIFGGLLSYQWFQFGSADDYTSSFGNNFDGYSNIREKQEYAKQWEGNLTDKTLQAMVIDYQKRVQTGKISNYEMTNWIALNSWVQTLWPELEETDNRISCFTMLTHRN